jgi:uncharacterized protein (TIGR02271 family)
MLANPLDPPHASELGSRGTASGPGGTVVQEETLPLAEENLVLQRRTVETGTVRVRTVLQSREEVARAEIYRQAVSVEHVPINREIDEVPTPWEDGDILVIPVVEEILVVEKRLILREEVRVRRRREVDHIEQPVTLRTMEALVERHAVGATPARSTDEGAR